MASRSWCFTLNNPTNDDNLALGTLGSHPLCRYIVFGSELGEQEGTSHFQGYVEFVGTQRFSKVKSLLKRAHIEPRKGTREQAREYCLKGAQSHGEWGKLGAKGPNFGLNAKICEFGDWNAGGQGTRTDLDRVRQLAVEDGMRAVTTICNAQQIRVAEKFLQYNEEVRNWKPTVIWIHGPTGTGKSRVARSLCNDDYYAKKNGTKWWDGYDGHENLIIDDFRDSWWSMTEMLSILDRYEHPLETKGGWRQLRATQIIITSAFAPSDCYRGCGEQIEQLLRRVDIIESTVDVGPTLTKNEESIIDLSFLGSVVPTNLPAPLACLADNSSNVVTRRADVIIGCGRSPSRIDGVSRSSKGNTVTLLDVCEKIMDGRSY